MARFSRFVARLALSASAVSALSILTVATLPGHSAAAAAPGTYVVRNGDSLYAIATRLRVTLDELLTANGLSLASTILPGQQLRVPGATTPPTVPTDRPANPAAVESYTVRSGDSLGRIASRHGVSLTALLSVNAMTATSLILPGQTLALPAGAVTSSASAPPAPVPQTGGSYTVRAGDSLGRIASRHGVPLSALVSVNAMTAASLILPGQTLTLPVGAIAPAVPAAPGVPAAPAAGSGGSYVVRAGDSLGSIASRHEVPLSALLSANAMTATSLILPGQTLSLPVGARLPTTPTEAPAAGTPIDTVVAYALAQLGKPYRFFSDGPDAFDCSGLTKAAYGQIGVRLIHQSASQARQGSAVDFMAEPIRAGDLVFLITRDNEVINHVGMAISATQWIHAPAPNQPVRVGPLPSTSIIVAVRRFV